MISKYQIITNDSAAKLAEEANALIAAGWQPLGGISGVKIRYDREGNHVMEYAQALGFEPVEESLVSVEVSKEVAIEGKSYSSKTRRR